MNNLAVRIFAAVLVPCLILEPALAFPSDSAAETGRPALGAARFLVQAVPAPAVSFALEGGDGPLWFWTNIFPGLKEPEPETPRESEPWPPAAVGILTRHCLFSKRAKDHFPQWQAYEHAQAMAAEIPPGRAYRGMRLTLADLAKAVQTGLRCADTTYRDPMGEIWFSPHRWKAIKFAFDPEGNPPEENFVSVVAVSERDVARRLGPGVNLPADQIQWYVYDKDLRRFVDLKTLLMTSPAGILPAVAERLGKYFGGKSSRLYRWVAGPFIEEWWGPHFHKGAGICRLWSYAPLGLTTIPLALAVLFHAAQAWGVPPALTFLLHGHALALIAVIAAIRWKFIRAHPSGQRAPAVVISVANSILPLWIFLQSVFTPAAIVGVMLGAGAIHGFINIFGAAIQKAWNALLWHWLWRRADTPEADRRAIRWSFDRYIESYGLGAEPEFNIPTAFSQPDGSHEGALWPEVFAGMAELIFHLEGASFYKLGLDWLTGFLRKVLIWRMERQGRGAQAVDIVRQAIQRIRDASLAEKRELLRGYFQRSGYLMADLAMNDFPAYDKSRASSPDFIGDREQTLQMLEGYFYGVMAWKRGAIVDELDKKILRFLEAHLEDRDRYVAKAAIRAIGVVNTHLTPVDSERLLQRYHRLLARRRDEVVQGSFARDLSQELDSPRNVNVLARALTGDRLSPAAQAYAAESLESLLERYPLNARDDPNAFWNLVHLLLRKIENPHAIGPLRVSCLKALAGMRTVDRSTFDELRRILLTDPQPAVQESALFALANLACADPAAMEGFLMSLADFVQGHHAGAPNPFLESFGRELFVALAVRQHDPAVRRLALTLRARAAVPAQNPILFLDIGPLPAEDFRRLAGLRGYLRQSGATVIGADSFREDRDQALHVERDHAYYPQMRLRVERMLPALHNLSRNLPARETIWDPARRKRARRMENVLAPYAGQPVIIFGRGPQEAASIQTALKISIPIVSLSDYMSGAGRINNEPLRNSLWRYAARSPLASEGGRIFPAAPPLPQALAPLFRRSAASTDAIPLAAIKDEWAPLFRGDRAADPRELAALIHAFNPMVIYTDVDLSLTQKTNSSLGDARFPDNPTSLYFLAAALVGGRSVNCISLNSGENVLQSVHRPLELLLERAFPQSLKHLKIFYDAGAGATHPTTGRHFFAHGRQMHFPDKTRRALARAIVAAYYDSLPDFTAKPALPRALTAEETQRAKETALTHLEAAFQETTWTQASTRRRFEFRIDPPEADGTLALPALRLVDTGAELGLLIPEIVSDGAPVNRRLADALAEMLRSQFAKDLREEAFYLSSGSDYLSFSVTSKGLRVRRELLRTVEQWRNPRKNNKGPLRVLVMGDSDADIPMLGLQMEGVEILPIFLGNQPQPGMVTPAYSHARGAALAMASLLSPAQIREAVRARFDAYPAEAAYQRETQTLFEAVAQTIEKIETLVAPVKRAPRALLDAA